MQRDARGNQADRLRTGAVVAIAPLVRWLAV